MEDIKLNEDVLERLKNFDYYCDLAKDSLID